ncbi:MAG: hypothetical protein HYV09_12720 [Deltaproteobacteria bacterium]|nr:hypothetical protein [Deltaproteobacteria bacterium]
MRRVAETSAQLTRCDKVRAEKSRTTATLVAGNQGFAKILLDATRQGAISISVTHMNQADFADRHQAEASCPAASRHPVATVSAADLLSGGGIVFVAGLLVVGLLLIAILIPVGGGVQF